MNEKLAKEERRNLVKAMGETATDALERARAEVFQLRMEHTAIAKTVADLQATIKQVGIGLEHQDAKFTRRIDGASAWCERNENARKLDVQAVDDNFRHTEAMFNILIPRHEGFRRAGFLARLRWLLFGTATDPYEQRCCEMCGGREFDGYQCLACVASGKVRALPQQVQS